MSMSSRICPQCGSALAPDALNCSICGLRYVEQAELEPTQRSATANMGRTNTSLSSAGQAQYAFSPATPYGNAAYSVPEQSPATSPTTNGQSAPPPRDMDDTSSPLIVPLDDHSATNGQKYPGNLPPLNFDQLFVKMRRPKNLLLIVGVVILLLAILGGSIFAFSRSRSATITQRGTTANSPVTSVSSPASLFSENFADDSKGWGIGSGSGFSSTIAHNMLTMSEANHRVLDIAIPDKNNPHAVYSDFSVTTTFTLLKADQNDSAGLYLRGASTNGNFSQGYFVDIYGDNSYDIFKVFADSTKDTFLIGPTPSSAINTVGQQNKLTVVMKGSNMVVLVNDKILISVSDTDFKSGQIALFVENGKSSNGVQASFSSVLINPAPKQLPSS
ncbi:MAG: family 16 glycoside hydrolase [Ktedonobacteraceae bacterium]